MSRRARGEGSIYEEGDHWVASLSYVDAQGKRHRPKLRARTKSEARGLRDQLLRDLKAGPAPATSRRRGGPETLERYLERWLETVKRTRRPKTYRTYAYQARLYIVPALGHIPLDRLDDGDVERLLHALTNRGLSASTVHQTRRVLHTALARLVPLRLAWNPVSIVEAPHGRKREPHALDAEQLRRLLAATASDRLHALYVVTAAVGLRRGEVLGLRWRQDVDLEAGVLHVRGQLQRVDGRLEHVETKTGAGNRAILLPGFALAALTAHAGRQAQEAERAGRLWENHGFVFTTQRGRPLLGDNVYRRYRQLAKAAGFPDLTLHDLRHTALSLLASAGVHQRVAMEIAGHSRASLTTELYTHVLPEQQRAAAEALNELLGTFLGTSAPDESEEPAP